MRKERQHIAGKKGGTNRESKEDEENNRKSTTSKDTPNAGRSKEDDEGDRDEAEEEAGATGQHLEQSEQAQHANSYASPGDLEFEVTDEAAVAAAEALRQRHPEHEPQTAPQLFKNQKNSRETA